MGAALSIDELTELTELTTTLSKRLESHEPFRELRRRLGEARFPIDVEGVQGGFLAYLASRLHEEISGSTLLVVPTDQEAREVHADLQLFGGRVLSFPWWGTLPYGQGHPLPAVHGLRTYVLSRLQDGERALVITSLRGLLNPLPAPQEFEGRAVRLGVGNTVDTLELAQTLTNLGYLRVPRVSLRGEFALRGEVLDVFPYGGEEATRIIFDFDRITRIRRFEPFTQVSVSDVEGVRIPPTREVIFDEKALELLRANLEAAGFPEPEVRRLLDELRLNPDTPGSEYLFPLCSGSRSSLLDYLSPDSLLLAVDSEGLVSGSEVLRREYLELYRKSRSARQPAAAGKPAVAEGGIKGISPPPRQILLDFSTLESAFNRSVHLHSLKGKKQEGARIRMVWSPARRCCAGSIWSCTARAAPPGSRLPPGSRQ
jgi:transcription-repair coupling factor (superfamily II helicase)